jgi:23S rRNA (pseudouridine1915-N3)-methyltransferase
MHLTLAHIGARPQAKDPVETLVALYLKRCGTVADTASEAFKSEDAFLDWLDRGPKGRSSGGQSGLSGRTPILPVLLDSRGKQMTSEAFATWLGARRDDGIRHIVFAIGPASGWSPEARTRATLLLSLGPLTLAHALARLVLAEQLYRATTILTGHPYHSGH